MTCEGWARGGVQAPPPAVGGVCLRKATDLSQTRTRIPIVDRPSPSTACCRSWGAIQKSLGAMILPFQRANILPLQRANILPFGVQAYAELKENEVTVAFRSQT